MDNPWIIPWIIPWIVYIPGLPIYIDGLPIYIHGLPIYMPGLPIYIPGLPVYLYQNLTQNAQNLFGHNLTHMAPNRIVIPIIRCRISLRIFLVFTKSCPSWPPRAPAPAQGPDVG